MKSSERYSLRPIVKNCGFIGGSTNMRRESDEDLYVISWLFRTFLLFCFLGLNAQF